MPAVYWKLLLINFQLRIIHVDKVKQDLIIVRLQELADRTFLGQIYLLPNVRSVYL